MDLTFQFRIHFVGFRRAIRTNAFNFDFTGIMPCRAGANVANFAVAKWALRFTAIAAHMENEEAQNMRLIVYQHRARRNRQYSHQKFRYRFDCPTCVYAFIDVVSNLPRKCYGIKHTHTHNTLAFYGRNERSVCGWLRI